MCPDALDAECFRIYANRKLMSSVCLPPFAMTTRSHDSDSYLSHIEHCF